MEGPRLILPPTPPLWGGILGSVGAPRSYITTDDRAPPRIEIIRFGTADSVSRHYRAGIRHAHWHLDSAGRHNAHDTRLPRTHDVLQTASQHATHDTQRRRAIRV